jgi:hypothetical protein
LPLVTVTLDGSRTTPGFELVNVSELFVIAGPESNTEQEIVCPPVTLDVEQLKDRMTGF